MARDMTDPADVQSDFDPTSAESWSTTAAVVNTLRRFLADPDALDQYRNTNLGNLGAAGALDKAGVPRNPLLEPVRVYRSERLQTVAATFETPTGASHKFTVNSDGTFRFEVSPTGGQRTTRPERRDTEQLATSLVEHDDRLTEGRILFDDPTVPFGIDELVADREYLGCAFDDPADYEL